MKRKLKDSVLFSKVTAKDYSSFFAAVGKVIFHVYKGQWDEALLSSMDAGAAWGLEETEDRLAWKLVNRAARQAIVDLVKESQNNLVQDNQNTISQTDESSFVKKFEKLDYDREIRIDSDFFKHPKEYQFVKDMQAVLHDWLKLAKVEDKKADNLVHRFPGFFVYALHDEWGKNAEQYKRLHNESPFSDSVIAGEEWDKYKAYLDRQREESVFGETFSLQQIFVPLCAYYEADDKEKSGSPDFAHSGGGQKKRKVVDLEAAIDAWLKEDNKDDAIRIICGGPGSGKSASAKMFAASISSSHNVLFIPLYHLNLQRDLKEVVGDFLVDNRLFSKNPIGESEQILIIFDGLDEIMQQGKASLAAASDFVGQALQLSHNHNHIKLRVRIIITGRDLPVQEIATNFRKEGQILHVLPYYLSNEKLKRHSYIDPNGLLKEDRRDRWWQKYGDVTGKCYTGLPAELKREALDEITAQPLLNYLLALSKERGKITFSDQINLNELYADLVDAVYERGWQAPHLTLAQVRIERADYERVLEEIAVATWQGAGRTATLKDIEKRCQDNKLGHVLDKFRAKAEEGAANLLTAFYFRDANIPGADKSFEFTHKSFGEYLAARKIVWQLQMTKKALKAEKETQIGWSCEDALEHWIDMCGRVAIDEYIFKFLCNGIARKDKEKVKGWQDMLCELISHVLAKGMPFACGKPPALSFFEATRQSRNSEEALLAALSACSRVTGEISQITWPKITSTGEWLAKLCGQRIGDIVFVYSCLNYIDLSGCILVTKDLYLANLTGADLTRADLTRADLRYANLEGANLERASLERASLEGANLEGANLEGANLFRANLERANLKAANLERANLTGADLTRADLRGAYLTDADLTEADLTGVKRIEAKWQGAILDGVKGINPKKLLDS